MTTKTFKDFISKYRPMDLPEDDADASDLLVRDFVLTAPLERQQILDYLDQTAGDDMSVREYGRYRQYSTKLKSAHAAMKRVGR
jgi:hypothetical protein